MTPSSVSISPISHVEIPKQKPGYSVVCWVKNEIDGIEINGVFHKNVSDTVFFIDSKHQWRLSIQNTNASGYVLYLSEAVLNQPTLSNLHINKVRLFSSDNTPMFKLSPGIEKRTQSILEMIDELLGSHLNHKDEAILSLLNTFFIYCDGQCNIKTMVNDNNSKANIVYSFKKLADQHIFNYHEVGDYAKMLNISPKYLNECVKEVLQVSSKSILIEQLLMRSRHALKFSNKTIKEISFELGFSSPDYFSAFFKTQTGIPPSELRKA